MKQQITMRKTKNLTIGEAWKLFIRKCRAKNLSENTLSTYGLHYSILCAFTPADTPLKEMNSDTVDVFVFFIRENYNINDVTVNYYLRSVRTCLYYCMDCNYIESFMIRMTKVEKKVEETYTHEELERLLKKLT